MEKLSLVLAIAGVTAGHVNAGAEADAAAYVGVVPREWENHAVRFAPETFFERASRKLSHWAGYNKGNGFVVATSFSDDQCLHPVWESGVNVGRCMMAVDEDGNVAGSWKTNVVERKGKYEVTVNKYTGIGCWGSPFETDDVDTLDTGCKFLNRAIDGVGPIRSFQFSWNHMETTPKLASFKDAFYRGRVDFESNNDCNAFYDNMYSITRYWIQNSPDHTSCYQTEAADSTAPRSYRTVCGEGNDDTPGAPVNLWYTDNRCSEPVAEDHPWNQMFGMCYAPGTHPSQDIYGGARLYHSPFFGRSHGNAYREFCFEGGADVDEAGKKPQDKLAPWNTYKDITLRSSSSDGDDNGQPNGQCSDFCEEDGNPVAFQCTNWTPEICTEDQYGSWTCTDHSSCQLATWVSHSVQYNRKECRLDNGHVTDVYYSDANCTNYLHDSELPNGMNGQGACYCHNPEGWCNC